MTLVLLTKRCAIAVAVALLPACSTPRPVLELAGQGAATTGLAEISLRTYLASTQGQLEARIELLRREAQQEARNDGTREFDLFLARQAGAPNGEETAKAIRALGAEHGRFRAKVTAEVRALDAKLNFDPATMPQVPSAKLAAARKSFEVLAQELSPREWIALAVSYAKEIKAGLDKLQEDKAADGAADK